MGALTTTEADKSLPEKVNCWIFGLADAVPTHAVMVPVAGFAVITAGVDVGLTVMVKVTGGHPDSPVTKLPIEIGKFPTLMVAVTVLVEVFITETLLLLELAT